MRNKSVAGIFILGLIIGGFLYLSGKPAGEPVARLTAHSSTNGAETAVASPAQKRKPSSVPPKPAAQVLKGPESDSLDSMGHTLGQVGQVSFTLKSLLEELQKSGQQPLVVHDNNPDSGEMIIVRTKSPLPGTRYFHAQYFTDEGGDRFVQHMSFEFKPGPDAMAAAVATVERNFPNLSRPVVQREDYVKWTLDNNYIVWVKKMASRDLQDDPFNSYAASDDGTIRVAVELEIHGE